MFGLPTVTLATTTKPFPECYLRQRARQRDSIRSRVACAATRFIEASETGGRPSGMLTRPIRDTCLTLP